MTTYISFSHFDPQREETITLFCGIALLSCHYQCQNIYLLCLFLLKVDKQTSKGSVGETKKVDLCG